MRISSPICLFSACAFEQDGANRRFGAEDLAIQHLRRGDGLHGELLAGNVVQVARDVAALLVLKLQRRRKADAAILRWLAALRSPRPVR